MPRKSRIEYPGAIYHVMSRANGNGVIFETDVDRQDFVKILAETCEKAGFEVHAFCLMRNHFHLVVEMAARLRRETTLTMSQVAERLRMGSWKSLNAKLNHWRKENQKKETRSKL
jgi:REP element-mobilizing transposase RayT